MDQAELNKVAMDAINVHRREVAAMLQKAIKHDVSKRSKRLPDTVLRHVLNTALYDCVVGLNSPIVAKDEPKYVVGQYRDLAATLEPKFVELAKTMKEYRPFRLRSRSA